MIRIELVGLGLGDAAPGDVLSIMLMKGKHVDAPTVTIQ